MIPALEIATGSGFRYPVFCGPGLQEFIDGVWAPAWRQAVLVGDTTTLALYGAPVRRALERRARVLEFAFLPGEGSKTRATKAELEDRMAEAGIDRSACVVALGGGIVLDLAGFTAATYMRGIDHLNIATTLLAQVDAAIGGKTGVNTGHGKNLVGAFHPPRAVLLATACLATLPAGEMRNGIAEAVKHGVIADAALFEELERRAAGPGLPVDDALVVRCAGVKAAVVSMDEHDRGRRNILNFGHTVGHAVETATGHAVTHGGAVALGMAVEARAAERVLGMPVADRERLTGVLDRFGFPMGPPCGFDALRAVLRLDKKNRDGRVHCALPGRIGEMAAGPSGWTHAVGEALLEEAWEAVTREGGGPCSA